MNVEEKLSYENLKAAISNTVVTD